MNIIESKIELHNTYECILIDTKKNKVKQRVYTNNILTNNFIWNICYNYAYSKKAITRCNIGTGTGKPAPTDTKLFKHLYQQRGSDSVTVKRLSSNELVWRLTFTIPADTSSVGDITEIGLETDGETLITHALLKDSEGNPISIHKTDIDKLIINVEMHVISNSNSNFTAISGEGYPLAKYNSNLEFVVHLGINFYTSYFKNMPYDSSIMFAISNERYTLKDTNRLVYFNNRLQAGEFNNRYINAIGFTGLGFIKFPGNLALNTPVTGLSVGTGDGVTKQFDAPLDLFIKDSDKVYIDGILQTRGVDYTIDNKANRNLRPEVTPGNFMRDVLAGRHISKTARTPFGPFAAYINEFSNSKSFAVSEAYPMVVELEEDPTIGLEVNGVLFQYFYVSSDRGTATLKNVDLVLSYSDDNKNYTEATRLDLTNYSYGKSYDKPFGSTIKAKYWKLGLDFSKASDSLKDAKDDYYVYFTYTTTSTPGAPKHTLLYYKGEPITFTNPPADGAVITMDCNLDRPFKTDQWVIDCNPEFLL